MGGGPGAHQELTLLFQVENYVSALFERSRNSRIDRPCRLCDRCFCTHAPAYGQAGRVSMTTSVVKELYNSPNGDRWALCRDQSGKLVVSHQPNHASGGRASEIGVEAFLSQHRSGPEHQALIEALAHLDAGQSNSETKKHSEDKLSRALGYAVARCWKNLPQGIQEDLFEAAVALEGETIRQQLAIYLHGKREHTVDTAQPRAMPEPDSFGG
jgi:hypothetical protein